jgi:hypothetical protein
MLQRLRNVLLLRRKSVGAPVEPVPPPPPPKGLLDGVLKGLQLAPDKTTKPLLEEHDYNAVLAVVKTIEQPTAAQESNRAFALAVLAATGQPQNWQKALDALDRASAAPGAAAMARLLAANKQIVSKAANVSWSGGHDA